MGSRRSPRRGKDIVEMNSAAQFTTHFECPARLYYLLARGSALSLSFFFLVLSPNLTNALRFALSVAFYPTSRIVRVPLLRSESTRVEFLIHPPLFPLFFSRHVFLSACYDFSLFSSFLFFALSPRSFFVQQLPGCLSLCPLYLSLPLPPTWNYSVVSRIFIARIFFLLLERKFPLCNFSSFLQFLSPSRVAPITFR